MLSETMRKGRSTGMKNLTVEFRIKERNELNITLLGLESPDRNPIK
jgi:hypothetical protein